MENAVIGVFDKYAHARDAAEALVEAGFRDWAVQVSPQEESLPARQLALSDTDRYASSEGWSIGNFFRSLFGIDADNEHAHVYSEAVRRGSFLVTVEAEGDEQLHLATDIMHCFHPIDIDERSAHWRSRGWSRYEPHTQAYEDEQIEQERLQYGSAPESSSASHSETHQIRQSRVRSFRRTQGGASPGGGSDIGAVLGVDGALASDQDNRSAPNVQHNQHDQHQHDQRQASSGSMRNAAMRDSTAPDIYTIDPDADYRTHWQKALGMEGRYEDFAPAYRFGSELRQRDEFRKHHDWNQIEPEVRRRWETEGAGSPWERSGDAVRFGWEKNKP